MNRLHRVVACTFDEAMDDSDLGNSCLEYLLDDTKETLGFDSFDEQSTSRIYAGLSLLYLSSLTYAINSDKELKSKNISIGLMDTMFLGDLNRKGVLFQNPKNHDELKESLRRLVVETSEYLWERELDAESAAKMYQEVHDKLKS